MTLQFLPRNLVTIGCSLFNLAPARPNKNGCFKMSRRRLKFRNRFILHHSLEFSSVRFVVLISRCTLKITLTCSMNLRRNTASLSLGCSPSCQKTQTTQADDARKPSCQKTRTTQLGSALRGPGLVFGVQSTMADTKSAKLSARCRFLSKTPRLCRSFLFHRRAGTAQLKRAIDHAGETSWILQRRAPSRAIADSRRTRSPPNFRHDAVRATLGALAHADHGRRRMSSAGGMEGTSFRVPMPVGVKRHEAVSRRP